MRYSLNVISHSATLDVKLRGGLKRGMRYELENTVGAVLKGFPFVGISHERNQKQNLDSAGNLISDSSRK